MSLTLIVPESTARKGHLLAVVALAQMLCVGVRESEVSGLIACNRESTKALTACTVWLATACRWGIATVARSHLETFGLDRILPELHNGTGIVGDPLATKQCLSID